MRVLVIEHALSIPASLDAGLTRHGFTVDRTTSGRDGVRRAPSFDLVLLDLGLPDLDGKDVCRASRETASRMQRAT